MLNVSERFPVVIGSLGTTLTAFLDHVNHIVATTTGVLTLVYMIRQHMRMNKEKKETK